MKDKKVDITRQSSFKKEKVIRLCAYKKQINSLVTLLTYLKY